MTSSTYLELVNTFLDDYSVGGGGPLLDVAGQTGEYRRAVRWIRDANDQICNRWIDWRFLWRAWEGDLPAGSRLPGLPTLGGEGYEFGKYDVQSFYLNKRAQGFMRLRFQPYDSFRHVEVGAERVGVPTVITELPNRTLAVNMKTDRAYDFYCEGWKRPTRLAVSADQSDIPAAFERIIIVTAAIAYANHVDAPEVLEGAQSEYIEILEKLEASELPGQQFNRMSSLDDPLIIAVPGAMGRSTVTR